MGLSKTIRKINACLLGIATATTLAVGLTPSAQAAPNGNVVYFGDSFSANPDQVRNTLRGVMPEITAGYPSRDGCLHAPDNAPAQLEQVSGVPVTDWSCTAETSRGMVERVQRAINARDIHPGTRAVVLAAGMNNYGGFGALNGINILDPIAVHNAYMQDMRDAVGKVRRVAPNAQIIIPGQLTVADPSNGFFCTVNVVPNFPMGFPVPPLAMIEDWNRDNQIAAAREHGATFVDIRRGSSQHSTCAPDVERWVAGMVDTTTPNYNMAFHPSRAGSHYVAQRISEVLR